MTSREGSVVHAAGLLQLLLAVLVLPAGSKGDDPVVMSLEIWAVEPRTTAFMVVCPVVLAARSTRSRCRCCSRPTSAAKLSCLSGGSAVRVASPSRSLPTVFAIGKAASCALAVRKPVVTCTRSGCALQLDRSLLVRQTPDLVPTARRAANVARRCPGPTARQCQMRPS